MCAHVSKLLWMELDRCFHMKKKNLSSGGPLKFSQIPQIIPLSTSTRQHSCKPWDQPVFDLCFLYVYMYSFCNLTVVFVFVSLESCDFDHPSETTQQPCAAVASFACGALFLKPFLLSVKEAIRSILFLRSLCNDDCSPCVVFPSQNAFQYAKLLSSRKTPTYTVVSVEVFTSPHKKTIWSTER